MVPAARARIPRRCAARLSAWLGRPRALARVEARRVEPEKPRDAQGDVVEGFRLGMRAWHRPRSRTPRLYRRRVLCESVNSSIKRRFGQCLRTRTARRHDKEAGWRIIAHNTNMVGRAYGRRRFNRR